MAGDNNRYRVFRGETIYANGDYISLPNIECEYDDPDAVAIIEIAPENGQSDAEFAFEMSDMYTHSGIEYFYGKKHTPDGRVNVAMKGRFWTNRKVMSFWKDNSDMIYPSSQDLKYYADEIKNYQGEFMKHSADISGYYLVKQLDGEDVDTVIMLPVMDYIRGNFTGEENKVVQFEPKMGVPDRIRQFPGEDEYTKLRNYRVWNGMEIDEGKILKEDKVTKIANGRYTVYNLRNGSATPDGVYIKNMCDVYYRENDAYAIAVFLRDDDSDVEISYGGLHRLMLRDYIDDHPNSENIEMQIAGRLWKNHKIITFWNDNYLGMNIRYPSSQDMRNCLKDVKDISSYTLYKELRGEIMGTTIIAIPVMDYIRGGFTGQENKISDFDKDTSPAYKINRFPGEDEYTKLRNYRAWNGMEIDEEKNLLASAAIPPKLYHATPSCYLNSIRKYGLGAKLPTKRFWDYGSTPYANIKQGVFLATDPYVAEDFLDSSDEYWEMKEEYEERYGKEISIVVLEIDAKSLDLSRLSIDENNSDETDLTYFYNGVIPASRIRIR